MDNSLVTNLQSYVVALFKDLADTYTKPSDLRRDQTRLLHELGFQGSKLMTLDFPAALKHFDMCLDRGLYTPSNAFLFGTKKDSRLPKFLGNLLLQVFHTSGKLRVEPSIQAVVSIRQLLGGIKKLKLPCKVEREYNAVKDFIDIETVIRKPTYRWDSDSPDFGSLDCRFDGDPVTDSDNLFLPGLELQSRGHGWRTTLQRVCDVVSSQFGDLHSEDPNEIPKHGPGVVSEYPRDRSKFSFESWPLKLEGTFPFDRYGISSHSAIEDPMSFDWPRNREVPSRMIAVPKTQKAPRLIAAEPVEHMWIQQLVRNQLESRCAKSSIRNSVHFRDQGENQDFARRGSIDGSFATVDLSSASDRLTCWTVERVFRANLTVLQRLHACRTRWVRNDLHPSLGKYIALKKFANQGSACTFPVQTLVYTCVAIAALLFTKKEKVTRASIERASLQVRVFGDDIILPRISLGILEDMLAYLGLKVNAEKTYSLGNFRESCGGDFFLGHDVRVSYLAHASKLTRGSRSLLGSYVEVSNNFFERGFWNVATWITNQMGVYSKYIPNVPVGCDAFGFKSYTGFKVNHLKKRWNADRHCYDYRSYVPYSKRATIETKGINRLFKWFIEKPRDLRFFDSATVDGVESNWTLGWRSFHFYTNFSDSSSGCSVSG